METKAAPEAIDSIELVDPRQQLAEWANAGDEWVRLLVAEVLATGRPVGPAKIAEAYQLFRQEKAFDKREHPAVPLIKIEARKDESAPPLSLIRLSEVRGVNALVPHAVIEPHEGLTVIYGENGTGKTGYSRILKAVANSRTADTILGNIGIDTIEKPTAKLEFRIGEREQVLTWTGEVGLSPFTRMSIFDSPAVRTHVDEDLDYVYTPATLALFNDVTTAIQAVAAEIDSAISELGSSGSGLLSRFQPGSRIYPSIETLGPSTNLADLKSKAKTADQADQQLDVLVQEVSALRANTIGAQIAGLKSEQRVLAQAVAVSDSLLSFELAKYNEALAKRAQLTTDYATFRRELFAAADLPADPDGTWNDFIEAGEIYRQHLVGVGAHDADRCLYCRQPLLDPARDLLTRYSTYLEYKISADIRNTDKALGDYKRQSASVEGNELVAFIEQYGNTDESDRPSCFAEVKVIEGARRAIATAVSANQKVTIQVANILSEPRAKAETAQIALGTRISDLEALQNGKTAALAEKQIQLRELKDELELGKSWTLIEAQVNNAKEIDRLEKFKRQLSLLRRSVTTLATTASDQLINRSFDSLFLEECAALRAPALKVQFVGRQGKAQRRKVLSGKHKPSKVLSEGEQKVLALADFLAEARLAGTKAPIIFDDPVSSLDHRRVKEVAQRIARLANDNQVIVFTHDILFATTLLALFEKSKRCAYFQITDEDGKGKVSPATGPRIDSLGAIKRRINNAIQAAEQIEGEARDALVHTGYSHLRSWCEVFTEDELLKGVTRRYQANVQMTTLANINIDKLGEIIPKVTEIFGESCRYIDGHSQALITQGVSPTLAGLKQHWEELQKLKKINEGKAET